jgi:hypothetical protein
MESHEGFEPTGRDKMARWRRGAERCGLREVLGEQSNSVVRTMHDQAIQTLAVQLMLAEVADGLTAGESRRQQLAIGRFRCVAFADSPTLSKLPDLASSATNQELHRGN